jgi:hypothetical protein
MILRAAAALLFGLLVTSTTVFGWYRIYSGVQFYDDEGFVMLSLRLFLRDGGLYDRVYAQYGPAYFLVQWASLGVLRSPVTHDAVRLLTLAHWVGAALFASGAAFRLTRSPFAAALAYLSAFATLIGVANEPAHPQSLCALLIAGIVFAGTLVETGGRASATLAAGAVGTGAALLLLTKANLGAYLLLALALTVASSAGRKTFARVGFLAAGVAGLLLPIGLMWPLLSQGWAVIYCAIVLCSVAATALALAPYVFGIARTPPPTEEGRHYLTVGLASFLLASLAVCGVVLTRGTTPAGLLYGVVFQHLDRIGSSAFHTSSTRRPRSRCCPLPVRHLRLGHSARRDGIAEGRSARRS